MPVIQEEITPLSAAWREDMNKKPPTVITRPLDKIVRRRSSFVIRKCSRCQSTIGTLDGAVSMKTGTHCIPCAETLGAFDRFHDV